jgi:hypothetical protein
MRITSRCPEETDLPKSQVRAMPGEEQDRGVCAVSSEAAAVLPVRLATNPVPGLVRHAMDTGHLVVRRQLVSILALQVLEAQDEEVILVGKAALKFPDLPAEGHGSYSGISVREGHRSRGLGKGEGSPSAPGVVGIPVIAMLPLIVVPGLLCWVCSGRTASWKLPWGGPSVFMRDTRGLLYLRGPTSPTPRLRPPRRRS